MAAYESGSRAERAAITIDGKGGRMKLRTLSESLGAVWVALFEALDPDQRARASRVLADALDDGAISDPLARCLVESIAEDAADLPPWHSLIVEPTLRDYATLN